MRRFPTRFALLCVFSLLSACAGGDSPAGPKTPAPPPTPAPIPPGILSLTVAGLPAGANADITVAGAAFSRAATGTTSWVDIPAGQHTVTVRPVRTAEGSYSATPSTFTVTVVSGSTPATATITYAPSPSAIDLSIVGVPGGVDAPVVVSAPSGGDIPVAASRVLTNPSAGRWKVTAAPLLAGGFRYTPSPATVDTLLKYGDTARVAVRYDVSSGALAVALTGLPAGAVGAVQVTGPDGFTRALTATSTLTELTPGIYRVIASDIAVGGIIYRPLADTVTVQVAASLTAAPATVTYAAQIGRVAVTTSGLPANAAPAMTLTGGSVTRALSAPATVDSLPAGTYELSAALVTATGVRYAPVTTTQSVVVTTGNTTTITVAFAPVPTVVEVPVSGLPNGVVPNITLTAPSGDETLILESRRISPAAPGRWRLSAGSVTSGGAVYLPTPSARDTTISAGDTLRLPVQYAVTTGAIAVVVGGLPGGAQGNVTVTGPGGYSRSVTATSTLTLLVPGSYTVSATTVSAAGSTYLPTPTSQQVTVTASIVASPATVSYAVATGAVTISAIGVPGSLTPTFSLTGTGAPRTASGAGTVSNLQAGSWTITANTIVSGPTTYTPSPSTQTVTITPNGTASASFTYTDAIVENYTITNVYLTQAIQRLDNSVTLVAGRDALLRVFVRANAPNTVRPDVRVRIYDGASLLQTTTIPAPESGVRTAIAEGTLTSTWNLLVPGANIRPTTRVLVDLDPTQATTDVNRSDNVWPTNGTPQSVSVTTVPAFNVRFVPIVVGALRGDVSEANKAAFLSSAQRMFPLNAVVSDVRAPFTSSATEIQSNDTNGQWLTVLSEINALRITDGAPATMHYYGVLKVSYTSGIAGYGFVPGRAAIGWDHLPSGDRVAAHEWGHNFSRNHAPCGTSGDTNYPHVGGVINFWGWNSLTNTLVSPTWTDVMGYCSNQWISDYNWAAVMQYRSTSGGVSSTDAPGEGLLVWGRVVNGQIQLEPAFRVNAPVSAGAVSASHRLELLDADGTTLLDRQIETQRVDHATAADERQFAVIVPWSATLEARLASIRVRDVRSPLSSVVRRSARMTAPAAGGTPVVPQQAQVQAQVARTTDGRARVTWNSSAYPMAMVRDASTGALMGFVRRSGDAVVTGGRAVEVVYSDGVRTVRQ